LALLPLMLFSSSILPKASAEEETDRNRFNVLFLAVDDLRPELGCYGIDAVKSPNIDRLSHTAMRFNRHFVQVPTCGASRYALLTGRRTSESGARGNHAFYSGPTALPAEPPGDCARSMPEMFRKSGYHTVLIGKLSHTADGKVTAYDGTGDRRPEMPGAWDEMLTPYGPWKRGWGIFFAYADGRHREDGSGYMPLMEHPDCADNELPDGMMADRAIEVLRELQAKDRRFFFGLGFFKPHLPFVAPKRYWDLYEQTEIPLPANPEATSKYSHRSGEFYKYQMTFDKTRPLAPEAMRRAKRAYYACVSYTDAQIGRVLAELDRLGLADETIVVLWGDHGWHLGEHQVWGKHTPLERSLNSPLILRVPGMETAGKATEALVETLDIYPTLVDLCQLSFDRPCWPLAGTSLAPVLENPDHPGKTAAFGYWRGDTVRTDRYRLIADKRNGQYRKVELYDHREDPLETRDLSEKQPERVKQLLRKLEHDAPEMQSRKGN
jgi:arylsulfatase A-like enzyme